MNALLTETQVSEQLQVSLACLRRWRLHGEGPQYLKVGLLFDTGQKTSRADRETPHRWKWAQVHGQERHEEQVGNLRVTYTGDFNRPYSA